MWVSIMGIGEAPSAGLPKAAAMESASRRVTLVLYAPPILVKMIRNTWRCITMRYGFFAGCLGLLALTGCTSTSTTAPVADTRAANVEAVKAVEVAWAKDAATKDVDKFAGYYADDASVLMPGAPLINGKENIKAALKPMLADPNFALTFEHSRGE